jgi:hypothetical protein
MVEQACLVVDSILNLHQMATGEPADALEPIAGQLEAVKERP